MPAPTLRQRNRLAAMEAIQVTALDLFQASEFDRVTVEDIAAAAGVSASTVYRYFGSKEMIVLWDELDAEITDELLTQLKRSPPLHAFRDALIAVLAPHFERNRAFQLQRVGYIFKTSQIYGAAAEQQFADRDGLASAFATTLRGRNRRMLAQVLAAAGLSALDVALDHWQQNKGKQPLTKLIEQAFEVLDRPVT